MGFNSINFEKSNYFSVSIVLYNHSIDELNNLLSRIILVNGLTNIYLIDNSPDNKLNILSSFKKIKYIHNGRNLGFGAGHNIAINLSIKEGCKYHFVVNPDIYIEYDVFSPMISKMQSDSTIGLMMPEILNHDRSVQYLPKLLPTPFSFIYRILYKKFRIFKRIVSKYELRFVPRNTTYNTPILSGCFTLLNLDAVKKIGYYDEKYFLYFEDWDFSRRINARFQTVYYPNVSVFHGYQSASNKNFSLLLIHLKSVFIYFNKWGWFFDKHRRKINKDTLQNLFKYDNTNILL
jgi:GT2 family glycosyltransferase